MQCQKGLETNSEITREKLFFLYGKVDKIVGN